MTPRPSAADLKAIAHPLRFRILRCIPAGINSPVKLYKHLRDEDEAVTLAQVAYHVSVLADAKLAVNHRQEQVRGAQEHFYRLTARGKRLLSALGDL